MAGRRYLNTAVLCCCILLVSLILHYATRRGIPPENLSRKLQKSANLSIAIDSEVVVASNTPIHNAFDDLEPRAAASGAWKAAVLSGGDLLCMMKMTKDQATRWVSTSAKWSSRDPVTSRFNDPQALREWGWVPVYDGALSDGIKPELHEFMNRLDLYPTTSTAWVRHKCDHTKDWNVNGVKGKAISRANYKSYFSKGRVIAMVIDTMYSPQYFVKEKGAPSPAPDLSRPSDVWFLLYWHHGQKYYGFQEPGPYLIQAPSHIFIQNIVTPDVRDLFVELSSKTKNEWPNGLEFHPESEEGRMLMGTKHGAAVAMFFIQHKDFFGDRVVRSIRIWRTQRYRRWNLYFEIGDVTREEQGTVWR
ncbi:hypothetical protein BLS_001288 [Venturia inaequalis]|uniref:Uncharacterized protein n=1 Tax=Venturia inaequalis TaxID=5025 RepID=A0A8H3ZCG0_VENIN|nr:hypothetical protein BLS_001288 [Venturia inaequalis]KAE9988257.1 hypothetical protein EG327_003431 [Venturia inaequalis]